MGKKNLNLVEAQTQLPNIYAPRSRPKPKKTPLKEMSLLNILKRTKTYTNIVAVGDIHGKTAELGYRIKTRYTIKNSVIFLCGDIGVGFNKPNYHIEEFTKLNNIAKGLNNIIIVIRGNHDDPSYFDGSFNKWSNIAFVPDYTLVETASHKVLCIGGGISIDRTNRTLGRSYWANEVSVYDEDKLKAAGVIDIIMTHSAPSFCEPITKDGIMGWAKYDDKLLVDCDIDRQVFDDVWKFIKADNQNPLYWCYGHFHMSRSQEYDNTKFKAIDELEFFPLTLL